MLADNEIDPIPHGNTCLAGVIGKVKFPKRTYVNLSKDSVYEVEYDFLQPWNEGLIQFDKAAIQRIKTRNPF